jgi:tRNA threonylcarbamoyladenosine biosynthesis protein TsaB
VVTLALDTSTRAGSIAVRRDGVTVHARAGESDQPHATRLPHDLLAALRDSDLGLGDVTLLAVCLGPGAFTGLRVGLATIQGLAFARGLPTVGVSAFDAMAFAALVGETPQSHIGVIGDRPQPDSALRPVPTVVEGALRPVPTVVEGALRPVPRAVHVVAVWLDGARGEVFAARYRHDPDATFGIQPLGEPVAAKPDVVLDAWQHDEWQIPHDWTGDGAGLYRDVIARRLPETTLVVTDVPRAALVADLAERAYARGLAGPPHALRPAYVRRSDAELARERAVTGSGRT